MRWDPVSSQCCSVQTPSHFSCVTWVHRSSFSWWIRGQQEVALGITCWGCNKATRHESVLKTLLLNFVDSPPDLPAWVSLVVTFTAGPSCTAHNIHMWLPLFVYFPVSEGSGSLPFFSLQDISGLHWPWCYESSNHMLCHTDQTLQTGQETDLELRSQESCHGELGPAGKVLVPAVSPASLFIHPLAHHPEI